MGYKLLGFLVWNGAKLFLRRRMGGARKVAFVGGGGMLLAAGIAGVAVVAVRRRGSG